MTENAPNQTGNNYFLTFFRLLKSKAALQEKDGLKKPLPLHIYTGY